MPEKPTTVRQYLDALPPDRRETIQAVRKVVKANLDAGFKEGVQYGMIGYFVPHSVYPPGYHCDPKQPLPYASIASQKNHISLYLFCIYCDPAETERFASAWKKTGKRLDMGKSCVRFKKLEDVPLDVIGKTINRVTAGKFIKAYEAGLGESKSARKKSSKKTAKKTTKKKVTKKKTKRSTKKAL